MIGQNTLSNNVHKTLSFVYVSERYFGPFIFVTKN